MSRNQREGNLADKLTKLGVVGAGDVVGPALALGQRDVTTVLQEVRIMC